MVFYFFVLLSTGPLLPSCFSCQHSYFPHLPVSAILRGCKMVVPFWFYNPGQKLCCGDRSIPVYKIHLKVFRDRKSTRLNSSHTVISYAVFCLKKKTLCPNYECGVSACTVSR